MLQKFRQQITNGKECVFVDECCFTWRGYMKKCWAGPYSNIELKQVAGSNKHNCIACLGAITATKGKELFCFTERAFDGKQFLEYFKSLVKHMGQREWFMVLDNASIHKAPELARVAAEHKVPLVYTVPYCPWFNGIEEYWAETKLVFRKLGTKSLLHFGYRNIAQEANDAVHSVEDSHARSYARRALETIELSQAKI